MTFLLAYYYDGLASLQPLKKIDSHNFWMNLQTFPLGSLKPGLHVLLQWWSHVLLQWWSFEHATSSLATSSLAWLRAQKIPPGDISVLQSGTSLAKFHVQVQTVDPDIIIIITIVGGAGAATFISCVLLGHMYVRPHVLGTYLPPYICAAPSSWDLLTKMIIIIIIIIGK